MDEDKLLTVNEIAERMNISEFQVRKAINDGFLKATNLGSRMTRVLESEYMIWRNNKLGDTQNGKR
jgi:excisionase family DNA binding protein